MELSATDGHEEIIMVNKLRLTLPILAAFLFMGITPVVQAETDGSVRPVIKAVITDYDLDLLIIFGTGLFNGETLPTVTFNGEEREVSVTEEGEVLVDVNLEFISPGDYLLVLRRDHRVVTKVEIMLTLGAEGPPEPPGPAGTAPGVYTVYSSDLNMPANLGAAVRVHCHFGDVAIGGSYTLNPADSTRVRGGTNSRNYEGSFINPLSDYSVRMDVTCLDFSEPRHTPNFGLEAADCDFEDGPSPVGIDCLPPDH